MRTVIDAGMSHIKYFEEHSAAHVMEQTTESPLIASLQEMIPHPELHPLLVKMHQWNLTDGSNESLAFVLHFLNGTLMQSRMNQKVPVVPSQPDCDFGFRDGYQMVHGYLALTICILGVISNILNILILTRREMINSTNTILTGLAVADLLLLLEYSCFACTYITDRYNSNSFIHASYILFHAHFSQVTHTVAISLTVTLAVWRYIAICKPHLNLVICTLPRSRLAVAISYALSAILNIPNFLILTINKESRPLKEPVFRVDFVEKAKDELLQRIHFWVYSVLFKILPCALLTVLIFHIIRAMYLAKKRKKNLMNLNLSSTSELDKKIPRMERLTEKTTRMLLTVLLLFLLTELPQGILSFLSGVYGHEFFKECYLHWGDFMDLLALVNSAINFLLYYIMSHQFRVTLRSLLSQSSRQNSSPRVQGTTMSTQI